MKNPELDSILEQCIDELQSGSDLSEVLSRHPDHARELRPLLEAAAGMRYNQARMVIPAEAQARSRRQFLTQAAGLSDRRGIFQSGHLRLAFSLIIIIVLVVCLLGTGLVSASALPGDTLYPVKLTFEQFQLSVASSTSQRLQLQDQFDQVRAQEVNELRDSNRAVTVTFAGVPAQMDGNWLVAGIKLDVSQQDSQNLAEWQNYVVQVTGETQGDTVKVSIVQPKDFSIHGKIEGIQPNYWVVDGVKVDVGDRIVSGSQPGVGQQVNVTAQKQNDGNLVATRVDLEDSGGLNNKGIGSGSGASSTPTQEHDRSGYGKGGTPGSPTGEPGERSTQAPDQHFGDRDHTSNATPEPQETPDHHGTRQPGSNDRDGRQTTPQPDRTPSSP